MSEAFINMLMGAWAGFFCGLFASWAIGYAIGSNQSGGGTDV